VIGTDKRVQAPPGRRLCEVTGSRESGGYRVFTVLDRDGARPSAGQFYMLAAAAEWGGDSGRPYLPRAFSFASTNDHNHGVALEFLGEAVGPGTSRLVALEPGEEVWLTGPLGRPFSPPDELNSSATGAVIVGGGIGIAPLAAWRRELAGSGVATRTLLGFRDEAHSGGLELFDCSEIRLASEDGHAGHRGYVTDLLSVLLEGDDAATAVVYACGPPAMLEVVRVMCLERAVPAELAMESPMACGFGACMGCAVPWAGGDGYMRLCLDGPVMRADEIETALVAGSGH
jgi:NAD(P)H-flavin reductase